MQIIFCLTNTAIPENTAMRGRYTSLPLSADPLHVCHELRGRYTSLPLSADPLHVCHERALYKFTVVSHFRVRAEHSSIVVALMTGVTKGLYLHDI